MSCPSCDALKGKTCWRHPVTPIFKVQPGEVLRHGGKGSPWKVLRCFPGPDLDLRVELEAMEDVPLHNGKVFQKGRTATISIDSVGKGYTQYQVVRSS